MKKIVLIIALFCSFIGVSQVFDGWKSIGKTTATIQAIPNNAGRFEYNSTTGSLWYNDGSSWIDVGSGGGGSGDVSAAATFGTDNVLIKSDGVGKGVQSTGITVSDVDNVDLGGGMLQDIDQAEFNDADSDLTTWDIRETTATNYVGDLAFRANAGIFGAIPDDGVIDQSAHLVTKAYGDANYSAGGGLANVVEDVTPEFAADLDMNDNGFDNVNFSIFTNAANANQVSLLWDGTNQYFQLAPNAGDKLRFSFAANEWQVGGIKLATATDLGSYALLGSPNTFTAKNTFQQSTTFDANEDAANNNMTLKGDVAEGHAQIYVDYNGNGSGFSNLRMSQTDILYNGTSILGSGSGNVSNTGTPVADQLAIFTDATTVQGVAGLSFDGTTMIFSPNTSPTTGAEGKLYANSTSNRLKYHTGAAYLDILVAGDAAILGANTFTADQTINANIITTGTVDGIDIAGVIGDGDKGDITLATSGTVWTVNDDAIRETHLKSVNAPTDEYVLTFESTTGDFEWEVDAGGGDIYKHPDSPVAVDSLYVGTVAQIAAADLGTTTLAFPTDATNNLDDLDDVNTATVTNRNVLVADGVDFESRALVALDVSDLATSTTTFTNKRITQRVNTIASSATPTPAGDTTDMFTVTALAAAATFAAPTGTPTDGQSLVIRIKDNATARTLAWNAIYRARSDFALPTTTVISETIYLQFVYNSADSKWDAVGLTQGF